MAKTLIKTEVQHLGYGAASEGTVLPVKFFPTFVDLFYGISTIKRMKIESLRPPGGSAVWNPVI